MKALVFERKARGWSQAELARRASLNVTTVNLIENGRMLPYATQLSKIATALGIPEDEAPKLLQEVSTIEQVAV